MLQQKSVKLSMAQKFVLAFLCVVLVMIMAFVVKELRGFVFAMPGAVASGVLIENNWEPWQLYFGLTACIAFIAAVLFFMSRYKYLESVCLVPAMLMSFSSVAAVLIVVADYALSERPDDMEVDITKKYAFVSVKYSRSTENGYQQLVFIGQQHIADLEYYRSLNSEVSRLLADGYVFFYEDTDALDARPSVADKFNTIWYNELFRHRLRIDVLRQPVHWPGMDMARWVRRDLGKSSPEVASLSSDLTDNEWCEAVFSARDNFLLQGIINNKEKKLAIVYGYHHFHMLRNRLAAGGWVEEQPPQLRPEGRIEPKVDEKYCKGI
ncbi:hypothetical protein [Azospirillum soli]|uniref:hypothetical protein n=1 Tax=Azospirillum soli TaxID=1304799 RepID=UPI001AE8AF26|nr:hypothetical protein [Azospirillum soli]MBP2311490.1 hypothetical protein [Azospirillum soli]